ncbi:hypothetical protein TRIP_B200625 [uncultured Desulfatiglans sp.]|nr:hypothetical protein TRIP_B200625 [uncultured Desulfatiglans sp.]
MSPGPDFFAGMGKMLMALLVVLAGLWAAFWAVRRIGGKRLTRSPMSLIQVLGSRYLGYRNQISLVAVPGALLVLGVSRERINLLARLDPDAAEDLAVECAEDSFMDQLRSVGRGLSGKDKRGDAI